MEIERKFLVTDLPDLDDREGEEVEQGYLAIADERGGAEVRLRRRGDRMSLTVKSSGTLSRAEEEIELDSERFDSLWRLTEGRRLSKRRYVIAHGDREIELDVYAGALTGLAVAEVEFPDEAAAERFEPPEWFGSEVTSSREYRNASLATVGLAR